MTPKGDLSYKKSSSLQEHKALMLTSTITPRTSKRHTQWFSYLYKVDKTLIVANQLEPVWCCCDEETA